MSIDGTDFKVNQPEGGHKLWYSHKFKYSAQRYEVGLCILTGDIVWISGPYAAGKWPDISIFRDDLKQQLDENERVVADDGYVGEAPQYVKCPAKHFGSSKKKKMFQRVRSRHETVNNRLKVFNCLKNVWRHDVARHSECFRACAVLVQLSIQNGEVPWQISYKDP